MSGSRKPPSPDEPIQQRIVERESTLRNRLAWTIVVISVLGIGSIFYLIVNQKEIGVSDEILLRYMNIVGVGLLTMLAIIIYHFFKAPPGVFRKLLNYWTSS